MIWPSELSMQCDIENLLTDILRVIWGARYLLGQPMTLYFNVPSYRPFKVMMLQVYSAEEICTLLESWECTKLGMIRKNAIGIRLTFMKIPIVDCYECPQFQVDAIPQYERRYKPKAVKLYL